MPNEIERKWLLKRQPAYRKTPKRRLEIEQWYLEGNVRIREEIDCWNNYETTWTATVKNGHGLVREEQEVVIPNWLGLQLTDRDDLLSISKLRREMDNRSGFRDIQVDIFRKTLHGLFLCEVEFNSKVEAEVYTLPEIIQEVTIREVTGNSRYSNYELAKSQTIPIQI